MFYIESKCFSMTITWLFDFLFLPLSQTYTRGYKIHPKGFFLLGVKT